jgi:hypothetical protein
MNWSVEANILEKHTVSIFRDEVTMQEMGGIIQDGRKGSLKKWANQDRAWQRLSQANGETPLAHSFRFPFLPMHIITLIPSNVT